jgi:alkylation response protein AidB-like acyl-CoA dehydrogenase
MIAGSDKELRLLDKTVYEFARKQLAPSREENDLFPYGPFFNSTLEKAFEADFFHTILPERLSGMGHGISAFCILLENICREDSSLAGIIFTNSVSQEIMLLAESENLLEKIITAANTVKDFLIAFPVFNNPTEQKPLVSAEKSDESYFLSGSIEYVVLGGIANYALLPAKLSEIIGYSFFLIELSDMGVQKSEPVQSLGLHSCPAIDIKLENVKGQLVGKKGKGNVYFEKMSDRMHVAAAAMSAGIMKGSFKEAFEYSRKRFQGGREIINWSEMKMIQANMALKEKISEMIVSRACHAVDNKEPGWEESSRAAALHVQEMACNLTTDGIQALGGVGYMKDYGQEKRFRDAKHIQALLGIVPLKKIKYIEKKMK